MTIESKQGDLEQVVKINSTITEWDEHFSMEHFKNFLEGKRTLITIGYFEEKPVGFIVGYVENESFKRWVTGVDPEHRGKGVFRSMNEYMENWAVENGLSKLQSDVAFRRGEMVKTNLSLGYRVVGFDFIDGLSDSRIFFEKDLLRNTSIA